MNDASGKSPLSLGLWASDAATEFVNGCIRGMYAGLAVGGVAAAQTDSTSPQVLSLNAAIGLLLTVASNGLKAVVVWHHSNPVPNPFRSNPKTPPPPQP